MKPVGFTDELVIAATIALLTIGFSLSQFPQKLLYNPHVSVPDGLAIKDISQYIVSDHIKKEMKRHGVQVTFVDWKDQTYFICNGRKIYITSMK